MLSRVLLLCAALSAMLSSASACSGEYCGRVDKGSCGNACCKLEWRFPGRDAVDVMEALNASLHAGGPDGLYTYSPAALASLPLTLTHSRGSKQRNTQLTAVAYNNPALSNPKRRNPSALVLHLCRYNNYLVLEVELYPLTPS